MTAILTAEAIYQLKENALQEAIGLLSVVIWPVVVIFLAVFFRKVIVDLTNRATTITVNLPGGSQITLNASQAETLLTDILAEIDPAIQALTPEECRTFLRVEIDLTQVPADFVRGSPFYTVLHNLRRPHHLIRPAEGGGWQAGKHIQLTTFGRIVRQYYREKLEERARQVNEATQPQPD